MKYIHFSCAIETCQGHTCPTPNIELKNAKLVKGVFDVKGAQAKVSQFHGKIQTSVDKASLNGSHKNVFLNVWDMIVV